MPRNQFQRMVFAFITVVITVHAYVFYSIYVVNGDIGENARVICRESQVWNCDKNSLHAGVYVRAGCAGEQNAHKDIARNCIRDSRFKALPTKKRRLETVPCHSVLARLRY